jgi:hypothetical protein
VRGASGIEAIADCRCALHPETHYHVRTTAPDPSLVLRRAFRFAIAQGEVVMLMDMGISASFACRYVSISQLIVDFGRVIDFARGSSSG